MFILQNALKYIYNMFFQCPDVSLVVTVVAVLVVLIVFVAFDNFWVI